MSITADICTDSYLLELADLLGLAKTNAFFIPGREEVKLPVPARFRFGAVRKWINSDPRFTGGIRRHHAEANTQWEQGHNIILTTGTSSGKSLVYMVEAMHLVLSDPTARIVALYPTQALNADQRLKWQEAAHFCNLPPSSIGIIDGRVPAYEREEILKNARVLITTPDSLDSWLMANLDLAICRQFIKNLRLRIIDEAHLNDGALGSNVMYLFRRLEYIQRQLNPDFDPKKHNRYIAASATTANAVQFMKTLTGHEFVEIDESLNGAPVHPKLIIADPLATPQQLTADILGRTQDKQFLIFMDKRHNVEELADQFSEDVLPYKSGMSTEFQRQTEITLRNGKKRGVVATSALEVGVDLAFDIAVNDGLPANLGRSFQRIGRVGRRRPGLFIFTNYGYELDEYGGDISSYLSSPLTPSVLYPSNEYIQLAHALRLKREQKQIREALGRNDAAPPAVKWPAGFKQSMALAALPAMELPWNLRSVVPPRGVTPHRYNGLRAVGGSAWKLATKPKLSKEYEDLGSTNATNAFHEYPPGAIIRHQRKRWRVQRWTRDKWGNMIIDMRPLYESEESSYTKHPHIKYGQADGNSENALLGNHVLADPRRLDKGIKGMFVGEVKFHLQIGLSHFLEDYRTKEGGYHTKRVNYHDDEDLARLNLEETDHDFHDYGPRRRLLINTTGIIYHIPSYQFGKQKRRDVAEALMSEYCEAYNFSRTDIGYQASITRFVSPDGIFMDSGNLVIYDKTAGSLRLTQFLVPQTAVLIERAIIKRQVRLDKQIEAHRKQYGSDEKLPEDKVLENLQWFQEHLKNTRLIKKDRFLSVIPKLVERKVTDIHDLPAGYVRVIPPGTRADWIKGGLAQRVKILEPRFYEDALCYEVFSLDRFGLFSRSRAKRFVRQDALGYISEDKPLAANGGNKNLETTRLLPASELHLTSGRYVGFNPTTGQYIQDDGGAVVEDISALMEDKVRVLKKKQEALCLKEKPPVP